MLPALTNAALLSTDAHGRVTRASEVRVGQVTAEVALTVSPGATLVMQGRGGANAGGGGGDSCSCSGGVCVGYNSNKPYS